MTKFRIVFISLNFISAFVSPFLLISLSFGIAREIGHRRIQRKSI